MSVYRAQVWRAQAGWEQQESYHYRKRALESEPRRDDVPNTLEDTEGSDFESEPSEREPNLILLALLRPNHTREHLVSTAEISLVDIRTTVLEMDGVPPRIGTCRIFIQILTRRDGGVGDNGGSVP